MATQPPAEMVDVTLADVTRTLAARVPLYRWRPPAYQTALLGDLRRIWRPSDRTVLDVGGGTGIIAQSIKELFALDRVVSVDVEDRFLGGLDIETRTYDGRTLPFADRSFDCVVMSNVVHHVPKSVRAALLDECGRVAANGAVYIKDHMAATRLDHLRLTILDLLGNVPFGGMVRASYLEAADWHALAQDAGFRIAAQRCGAYRGGAMARLFPNRLEVAMRWEKVSASQ
ncbi:MAG TPA: class I SAM-dependent methyltransferase [Xanthobacteraceae bacterium]|nr:class I SAM-dependent methyltransferase [Xanthobacteraceae bacterium]